MAQRLQRPPVLQRYFIIDFDSTFVRDESLDLLADIALTGKKDKDATLKKISAITKRGMEGKIPFSESLSRRLKLFSADRTHVKAAAEYLQGRASLSIERNRNFFVKNADRIYIISGGFKEYIEPVVARFGISKSHVLANSFVFGTKGKIRGAKGPLTKEKGKAEAIAALKLKGEVVVIGDGMTDYGIKQSGVANVFFAFTENVERAAVVKKADHTVKSFDEVLYHYRLPRAVFYPHGRLEVLLMENIHPAAEKYFLEQGCRVRVIPKALSESELMKEIENVAILGIRSTTQISKHVFDAAPRLIAVGAFCIGTNQIDLATASEKGIAVFNAPYSNGRSVVELAIGLIIILARRISDKSASLHSGVWDKSAAGAHEVRGMTVGIVGYGNIGSQLSMLAEAIGMRVVFYDAVERPALGNAKRASSLPELLEASDVVTLHVDGRPDNNQLFGRREFAQMRRGAFFLNLSRGHIVDIQALADALKSG
ncbi:MAG: HAD-IB family phosphatase, partial [Patescibacteria group bacterium]|nr:HAD-IB family phosphatase [Patescibacteria group bacterium]